MAQQSSAGQDMERRQYERLGKEIDLRFGPWQDVTDIGLERRGSLLDISAGGLRFLTREPVAIASQLLLVLAFPGWHDDQLDWVQARDPATIGVLKVIGMVVRCLASTLEPGNYEVAVCFCGRVRKQGMDSQPSGVVR